MIRQVLIPMILAVTAAGGAASSSAAGIGEQIAALKAVGPLGAGTAAAREAWRQLSAADATALPAILAALDDANPLAANWLRASIDAIAERQLRQGDKLPLADLETFALDTRHANRPRRLAFEWLCRVDKTAADRLIPKMLDDKSVEFRRDAVARLILEGQSQESADKKQEAAQTYRRALASARDLDQVQQLVKNLEAFGDKIDLPVHFGYVLKWKLIGPFDNTEEKGFGVAYPPEEKTDFAAEYDGKLGRVKWIDHASEDQYGKVDLNKALEKGSDVVGYAAVEFIAKEAGPAELRLQTTNANKIWLNGKLLAENKIYHAGSRMDQYIARGTLKAGRNLILLKICQNFMKEEWAQDWDFQFRVCDASGTAILSLDRVAQSDDQAAR